MHDQPILLHVVPVSFAVLLRLHRFSPRSGMSAVLRRGINDTIAGSVHCPSCWAPVSAAPKLPALCRPLPLPPPSHHRILRTNSIQYECARRSSADAPPSSARTLPTLTLTSTLNAGIGRRVPVSPCPSLSAAKFPEGKRMVSGHTGNVVPRKGLRVRVPCPPLF